MKPTLISTNTASRMEISFIAAVTKLWVLRYHKENPAVNKHTIKAKLKEIRLSGCCITYKILNILLTPMDSTVSMNHTCTQRAYSSVLCRTLQTIIYTNRIPLYVQNYICACSCVIVQHNSAVLEYWKCCCCCWKVLKGLPWGERYVIGVNCSDSQWEMVI